MATFIYDPDDSDTIIGCHSESLKSIKNSDEIFKEGQIWKDRNLLYSTVKIHAALTGWKPTLKNKCYIRCSCYNKPDTDERKYVNSATIKRGCEWCIKIKSTQNTHMKVLSGKNEGKLKSYPKVEDGVPVIISKTSCNHTGLCEPSQQQQILQRKRGGAYISNIGDHSLFTLCSKHQESGYVTNEFVKEILQMQFPKNKNVTKYDVYNMKRKLKTINPYMRNIETFQEFQHLFSSSKLEIGIDNLPITEDNIVEMSKEIWSDIINEKGYSEKSFFTFTEFMRLMKKNHKGFEYRLLSNLKGEYTGCIWQTSVMRENFERFGGFISIDAMKRAINTNCWPYVSITMYNELERVCLGCEAILTSERNESYKAIIDFVLEYSPLRTRDQIYVVAADGAINQCTLTDTLNLPNAKYMADQWHLFDSILPKRFGKYFYELIHPTLRGMCLSNSKEEFDKYFNNGMQILKSRETRNTKAEEELIKFSEEKETYSNYLLRQMRGSRGYHGSSLAESNHSSVLAHLNVAGNKGKNQYKVEPLYMVKELFARQEIHVNKWNEEIYHHNIKMRHLENKLEKNTIEALEDACSCLCLKTYQRYESQIKRIDDYEVIKTSPTQIDVKSKKHPTAPVRQCFYDNQSRSYICGTCEISCAFEMQCVHSILANDNKFIKCQFDKRHFQREKVGNSFSNMSCNRDNIGNMDFSDDDKDSDISYTGADQIANEKHTDKEQNASHYESSNNINTIREVKTLNEKELQDIFNEILSLYRSCSETTKFVLGSIAISAKDMCYTDGQSNGLFNSEAFIQNDVNMLNMLKNLISQHRNCYTSVDNNYVNSESVKVVQATKQHLKMQSKKRLKSKAEIHKKKSLLNKRSCLKVYTMAPRINKKISQSCGFCGNVEKGENINTCPKRISFRSQAEEFVLGKNSDNLRLLELSVENQLIYSPHLELPSNIVTAGSSKKGFHLMINKVWKNPNEGRQSTELKGMYFEIGYINKFGIMEKEKDCYDGNFLYSVLSAANLQKSKSTFVYKMRPTTENLQQSLQDNEILNFSQGSVQSTLTTTESCHVPEHFGRNNHASVKPRTLTRHSNQTYNMLEYGQNFDSQHTSSLPNNNFGFLI